LPSDGIMASYYAGRYTARVVAGKQGSDVNIADRLRLDGAVGQAGMGSGLACAPLAGAVAKAGGLGTLGLALPNQLRTSIARVRAEAPGRAVAVNLLMPFVRRSHVQVCVDARADVV